MDLFSLLPAKLRIDTPIPKCCHDYPGNRLVVAILLFDHKGRLYLVEPEHSPHGCDWLVFPQEKAKRSKWQDRTLGGVALRCGWDELELPQDQITLHPTALNKFPNPTPARHGIPETTKHTIVFGGYIPADTKLKPNRREIRRVEKVTAGEILTVLPQRPVKFRGILDACKAAVQQGLLPQPEWQDFVFA